MSNPEKPLVDDLAWVLASMVVGWEPTLGVDLAQHPEVQRVMARYGEYKASVGEGGHRESRDLPRPSDEHLRDEFRETSYDHD